MNPGKDVYKQGWIQRIQTAACVQHHINCNAAASRDRSQPKGNAPCTCEVPHAGHRRLSQWTSDTHLHVPAAWPTQAMHRTACMWLNNAVQNPDARAARRYGGDAAGPRCDAAGWWRCEHRPHGTAHPARPMQHDKAAVSGRRRDDQGAHPCRRHLSACPIAAL